MKNTNENDETEKKYQELTYDQIRVRLDSEDDKFFNRTNIFLSANTFQLFLFGAATYANFSYLRIGLAGFFLVLSIIWLLVGIQSRNFLNMLFYHPSIQNSPIIARAQKNKVIWATPKCPLSTINLIGIGLPILFISLWISLLIISLVV
jgi:hypothetical protein